MERHESRNYPGQVRDAILQVLALTSRPLPIKEIENRVERIAGPMPPSSIRSYLRLNTPDVFVREERGVYSLRTRSSGGIQRELAYPQRWEEPFEYGKSTLVNADCFDWIESREPNSFHAVVTDPPYGLHEYTPVQQQKLRAGKGGVWRIPPSFDGNRRSPVPRFTTLTQQQLEQLGSFFFVWGRLLLPKLVPGAHVVVASNPLVSYIVSNALVDAGLERRERNRTPDHDHARRRPTQGRSRKIRRNQRHAALDVGTMDRLQKARRWPCAGQPEKMENRGISATHSE